MLRKDRAVGVYPVNGARINREQLEETVLVVQDTVESLLLVLDCPSALSMVYCPPSRSLPNSFHGYLTLCRRQ